MPFVDLLTPAQEAQVRQAIGDVLSGTFGKHPFILETITRQESESNESPIETPVEKNLRGLFETSAPSDEKDERSNLVHNAELFLSYDYLVEEGVLSLLIPWRDREVSIVRDGIRYRVLDAKETGQFQTDATVIILDLERR